MKKLVIVLLMLFALFLNAQTISIVSETSNKPVPRVLVFDKNGNIIATTDIEGKFQKSALTPKQEAYQLVYNNVVIAELTHQDFDNQIIKVNDKTREIEQVVIRKSKPAKYIYLKGNFNTYLTINNKPNCYADGVITYIFDNKTKKLRKTKVEQYRVYIMEDEQRNNKQVATFVYDNILEVPTVKNISRIDELKDNRKLKHREFSGANKDEVEFTGEFLKEKEFSLFGYRFFDFQSVLNLSFEKNVEKSVKSFLEYNEIENMKIKHKSEPEYNQFIVYGNFYPTELSFENNEATEKVKFNKDYSNYSSPFWEQEQFPNMLNVFKGYFGNTVKEMPNKK